jgi:predicted permease
VRDWQRYIRTTLDLPAMTDGRDRRIVDELAAHLEEVWLEARARGATPEEADARAFAALGDRKRAVRELITAERHHAAAEVARRLERSEEALRARGRPWLSLADSLRDLRLGVRSLAKRPLFALAVVIMLALGIGSTTAVFTLVDAIVLSPLPFSESDRLVSLIHAAPSVGQGDVGTCAAWHFTYEDENRVFDELGMYGLTRATVTGDGRPEAVRAMQATSGVFRALRMNAIAGRTITLADEEPDAPAVVLLGHDYWRSRFGGDPAVVGRTLQVDGGAREIVGVLPASLRVLGADAAFVVPLRYQKASLFVGNVGAVGIARLKPGVTLEQAGADMARMLPLAFEKFPGGPVIDFMKRANYVARAEPLDEALLGDVARLLWVLLASVAIVLLIACANVANLFLVRAEGRQREMAVREALGAGISRIGWEYLKESLIVGLLGGLAGLALAYGGLRTLAATIPTQLPRMEDVSIDGSVLLFTTAVSLGAAIFFSVLPMVRAGRRGLVEALKEGGEGRGPGRWRGRAQQALVVGQMALALALLAAAGLVFRTAMALQGVGTGFTRAEDVLSFQVRVVGHPDSGASGKALMQEAIARRLSEIAGVTSVGMATALPMQVGGNINPLYVDGITTAGATPLSRRHKWIGEGYFETLGIPLIAGRSFTWTDVHNRLAGVVVSESLARSHWGSAEAAIGKRLAIRPDPIRWHEIIGVAGDVREDGLGLDPVPMVYWPQVMLAAWEGEDADSVLVWSGVSYAIRGDRVSTPGFLDEVRRAVWSLDPDLPLVNVAILSDLVQRSVARTSFTLRLLGVAAGMALILGLAGVYAVISYGVSRRAHELGMRMALGADAGQVRRMVLHQGFVLAAAGVVIGLGVTVLVSDAMSSLLFGVSPTDPLTFSTVTVAITAVALAGSYLPARRASRIDPIAVLKAE